MSDLDDAAAAALWALRGADKEHIALLYNDGGLQHTPFRSQDREGASRGSFQIPGGSLRALVHNHPLSGNSRKDKYRAQFSSDDVRQAAKLRVPSYIQVGHEIRRLDPRPNMSIDHQPGEAVLAQIPVEQIRRLYLAEGLSR